MSLRQIGNAVEPKIHWTTVRNHLLKATAVEPEETHVVYGVDDVESIHPDRIRAVV